jgi:hypothetical protein
MAREKHETDEPEEQPRRAPARAAHGKGADPKVQTAPSKARRLTVKPIDDEDDDEPVGVRRKEKSVVETMIPTGNPTGLFAYYLGVASILPLGLVTGPIAIILGIIGIFRSRRPEAGGLGHAITGIILGLIGTVFYGGIAIYVLLTGWEGAVKLLDLVGLK